MPFLAATLSTFEIDHNKDSCCDGSFLVSSCYGTVQRTTGRAQRLLYNLC